MTEFGVSVMLDRAKPFMRLFERLGVEGAASQARLAGRLAAQFGPTPLAALGIMQNEAPAVLEIEARRVLALASAKGIQ